ncbi:MAG: SHOCT domain-containing protein, partial [Deinococcota bacterium]
QPSQSKSNSALEDAEMRFAKGEISREEFDEIRKNA